MRQKPHTPDTLQAAATGMPEGVDSELALVATMRPGPLRRMINRDFWAGVAAEHEIGDARMELRFADSNITGQQSHYSRQDHYDDILVASQRKHWGDDAANELAANLRKDSDSPQARAEAIAKLEGEKAVRERELAAAKEGAIERQAWGTAALKVENRRDRLGRGGTPIAGLIGFLVTATPMAAILIHSAHHDQLTHLDPSILSGSKGTTIPGIPDGNSADFKFNTQVKDGSVTVTVSLPESKTSASGNTASNNYDLTPNEHALNRAAAGVIVRYAVENKATSATVTALGGASDENGVDGPNDGLGIPDAPNQGLADKRAAAGLQDFKDVASDKNLPIKAGTAQGREAILSETDITRIDAMADSLKLDRRGLSYAYNHDYANLKKAHPEAADLLDELYGAHRGVTYEVTLEVPHEKTSPSYIDKIDSVHFKGFPGEALVGIAGAPGLFYGLLFPTFGERLNNRIARRRAQWQVHRLRKKAERQ